MKTLLTKKTGDHEIIVGYDIPVRDPVATMAYVMEVLISDGDQSRINEMIEQIKAKNDELMKEIGKQKRKEKSSSQNNLLLLKVQTEMMLAKYAEEIKAYVEKKNRLLKERPVFFEPKLGEYIISEDDFKDLAKIKPEVRKRTCLKYVDGIPCAYFIDDFRGVRFFKKVGNRWENSICTVIAENPSLNAKEWQDLSDEERREFTLQKEYDKIKSMSLARREKERDKWIAYYLHQASIKKGEMEIQGDQNAQEKSKKYFEQKKFEMTEKYA